MARTTRVLQLLNYRLKITVSDGRVLIGQMLAFDKHMNLVLADTEEFKTTKKTEKRVLGLVILRGESIVSIAVEAPPPSQKSKLAAGSGSAKPAGRGTPMPTGSLSAPVRGLGPSSGFSMPPGFAPPGLAPPGFAPPPGLAPPGF